MTGQLLGCRCRSTPTKEAFVEAGAFQCGFCTLGLVLMTKALLDEYPEPARRTFAITSPATSAAAAPILK
jgi:aerobic-type carbon monoxide dehydrogenase small subunit (CoxS/CutS family)